VPEFFYSLIQAESQEFPPVSLPSGLAVELYVRDVGNKNGKTTSEIRIERKDGKRLTPSRN